MQIDVIRFMRNNRPPNPISNLVDLVREVLNNFQEYIASGQWLNLYIVLNVLLFLLFTPGKGLLYQSISDLITDSKQYNAIFWIVFFLLLVTYILFQIILLILESIGWIRLLLLAITVLLIISTTHIFLFKIKNLPHEETEHFSYGEISLFTKGSPERKIYRNNKQAIQNNKKTIKIAVSAPISRPYGSSHSNEFLRGVAIAQDKWNKNENNQDLQVVIGIADDGYENRGYNDQLTQTEKEVKAAKETASILVNQKGILAVVGHFGSDVTQAAASTYKNGKLVIISPSSTAIRQENGTCDSDKNDKENSICFNEYVFRVAIDDRKASDLLVKEIIKRNRELPDDKKVKKIAIAYDQNSTYSKSFKSAFELEFKSNNRIIITDESCYFSNDAYEGKECLDFVKDKANAILLIPGELEKADKLTKDIITENNKLEEGLLLLGSDTMYQNNIILDNNRVRPETEGMLIAITWHRKVKLSENCGEHNREELECEAAKIFPSKEKQKRNKPLGINWRTATSYEATKAILEGLKIANEEREYCGGFFNRFRIDECMREKLKDILISDKFKDLEIKGATANIVFLKNGERDYTEGLGTVVEVKNGNFIPLY